MDNFGVIEVATTKKVSAPGWAYVPDTGPGTLASTAPASRKRTAATGSGPSGSSSDGAARRDARLRKELDALNRDSLRDISIRASGERAPVRKSTPNVRRILASQKTFANHLADYDAAASSTPGLGPVPSSITPAPLPRLHRAAVVAADVDPLLASRVPPFPDDAELRQLLAAPALSYSEAAARPRANTPSTPARVFCEVCGYWGRVGCAGCGARLCALDCLELHRQDCLIRYSY